MFYMLIVLIFFALYFYTTRNYNYWAKRNVKHDTPLPLFGNHFQTVYKSIFDTFESIYNRYPDEKVVGYYRGPTPELIIRDPDIIRRIMNVDFNHFCQRGIQRDTDIEPLMDNIFHSDGDSWKLQRQRFSAIVSTTKIKNMFPFVLSCAEKLQNACEKTVASGGECDMRDLLSRYTIEFIGSCGFGIDMDTMNDENCLFKRLANNITTVSFKYSILMFLYDIVPVLGKYIYNGQKSVEKVIFHIFHKIRDQRNCKPIGRNDIIDLLLELETKGKMIGESIENFDENGKPLIVEKEMSFNCMAANVFIFFVAGFETSSSSMSYTLHELAFHPDIQRKIQIEIDKVLSRHDNKITYDAVAEMPLLSMAFKEGMRLFPVLGYLNRTCTKRYTIPELDITIDPGIKILIPVRAIHLDEKHYANPKQFVPERFSPNEVKERHKYVYLPFGGGPRECLGLRLAYMLSITGLAMLLHKFTVEPSPTTIRHPVVNPRNKAIQGVVGGLPLRLKPRET